MTSTPNPALQPQFRLRLEDRQITLIEGNSYELPFFLDNLSAVELSLALSLSGFPSEWISLPVPPVIRLPANQSQLASVSIILPDQGGALVGRYQGQIKISDQGYPESSQAEPVELTVVARQNQTRVAISLETAEGHLAPGEKIMLPVHINNPGSTEQYLEVSILGIPSNWISIPNPVVQIKPEERKTFPVAIEIPEAPRIQPGRYPIKIRAASQVDPAQAIEAEYVLNVAASLVQGRIGVTIDSAQYAVVPGSSAVIKVVVQNHGGLADNFRLLVEGIPRNWISTASPVIRLEPGASKTVELKIMPPRNPLSRAGRHTFSVRIASQSAPSQIAELEGTLSIAAYSDFSASLTPTQTDPQAASSAQPSKPGQHPPDVYNQFSKPGRKARN